MYELLEALSQPSVMAKRASMILALWVPNAITEMT